MRFLLSDILTVSIGAAVIAGSSFLYYKDITTKVQAGNNEVVGLLEHKRKTAERKYASQVVWEDIDRNVSVYNNDSIRTADQSEAWLRLNDGTEIKLNENSMILISLGKNQIDIEFSRGSMLAERGDTTGDLKKINIKSGKANILIEKSDVKLSQNKAGDLNLSVAKGNANIDTGKGASNIGVDKNVVIAKNSDDVISFDLGIKLVNPVAEAYPVTESGKKQIDFSWLEVKGEHIVFFELAKDASFDNIINKKEVKGNAVSIELGKGIYYWRIRAVHRITKKQEFSEIRRFTLLWDEPINLISPADKEIVSYRTTPPILNFRWTKSEIASSYRLVLSEDPAINKILKTFDAPENSLVLDSLTKGVYYWRIEKVSGLKDIPKTTPSRINSLNINEKKVTAPPELLFPNNAKQFSKTLLEKQNITFTWENNVEIREYIFSVAKDEKFENKVFTGTSKVNFLHFEKNLPKGDYYWRVSGKLDGNEVTVPSPYRLFSIIDSEEIKLISPAKNAILSPEENERLASVRFSWKATDIKGRYKLMLSQKKDFSSIYKESLVEFHTTGSTLPIDDGIYYWKVSLLDNDDSILVNSLPQMLTVKKVLDAPVVISPKDGYVVNMSDKNYLQLNWNRVAGANLYKVTLSQIIKGKEYRLADIEENGTSYKISDLKKLDTGKFSWKIQAFEVAGNKKDVMRKSSVIKNDFEIILGKPLEKVKVNSLKIESL